jgi:hypothetical protein
MRGAHGDDNQLIARRKKSTGKKIWRCKTLLRAAALMANLRQFGMNCRRSREWADRRHINDLVPITRITNTIIGLGVPASLKVSS